MASPLQETEHNRVSLSSAPVNSIPAVLLSPTTAEPHSPTTAAHPSPTTAANLHPTTATVQLSTSSADLSSMAAHLSPSIMPVPTSTVGVALTAEMPANVCKSGAPVNTVIPTMDVDGTPLAPIPFVPSLGAWLKPLHINHALKDPIPEEPPSSETPIKGNSSSDILPPELKADGSVRFPWAAKMDPKTRNLHRTTAPTYLEDGTPMVIIPDHVLRYGLENQKEYVIGQFYRCITPSGGLIHAVTNRIWGNKYQRAN